MATSPTARHRPLRDVIAPGLDVLFCGINPGLYSAATGWHFARPGNRFWPALAASGFTPVQLAAEPATPSSWRRHWDHQLVARATAAAAELTRDEIRAGGRASNARCGATGRAPWRSSASAPTGSRSTGPGRRFGRQPEDLAGALLWVLPNTSGLNAHYQAAGFARAFGELRAAARSRARHAGRLAHCTASG